MTLSVNHRGQFVGSAQVRAAHLALFDPALAEKPQIVVANKIDLPDARARIPLLEDLFRERSLDFCAVSAVTGEGVRELKHLMNLKIEQAKASEDGDRAAAGF